MKSVMRYAALPVLLVLAGCAQDPFDRPGTWSVPIGTTGANDANLRTMIADPRDLTAGTGEENSTGTAAAGPVRKLLSGRRAQLPQSDVSTIKVGTGGGGSSSGAAGNSLSQE